MTRAPQPGLLDQMQALSSAEDLFTFLQLPYDQDVLNRARLHVMKRMGAYLAEIDLETLDDEALLLEARKALSQAHDDFRNSTPREQKALKIFTQPRGNMVPLDALRPLAR